jgi:prepilin-type N-terminal cleavage/methylation domain-containing protein
MTRYLPNNIKISGFTLVEVLVVASVIGLLAGVGIASYNRFNEKQRVQTAAMEFATELRVVQKRANAGEKPSGCATTLTEYTVTTVDNSNQYLISSTCGFDGSKSLGPHAVFDGVHTITFEVLNRGLTSGVDILVMGANSSVKFKVTAEVGGVITVEEAP